MLFRLLIGLLLGSFFGVAALGRSDSKGKDELPELTTVPYVDLSRYVGTWYEIARYPNRFEKKCISDVTATYAKRDDGKLAVVNKCRKANGEFQIAEGKAKVADTMTNAKLKVSFFLFFYGDYWVIDLGSEYEYAVVGEPKRDYLWILSRTPNIEDAKYEQILANIRAKGYDTNRLIKSGAKQADTE